MQKKSSALAGLFFVVVLKLGLGGGMLLFAFGRVAELVDALRSGRSGRKAVEVQVLSRLPKAFG